MLHLLVENKLDIVHSSRLERSRELSSELNVEVVVESVGDCETSRALLLSTSTSVVASLHGGVGVKLVGSSELDIHTLL